MSIIRANIDTCDKDFMLDDFNGIYDCMMIETDGDVEISQEAAAWCKNAKVGDLYEFGESGSITIVDYEKQIIDEIEAEYEWRMKKKKELNNDARKYREFVASKAFGIVNLMSEILEMGRELSDKHLRIRKRGRYGSLRRNERNENGARLAIRFRFDQR